MMSVDVGTRAIVNLATKFTRISQLLALTNFLQFLIVFWLIDAERSVQRLFNLFRISTAVVLLLDLIITALFLISLANKLETSIFPPLFVIYVISSAISRYVSIQHITAISIHDLVYYYMVSGLLFALNLLYIIQKVSFPHKEKLQFIAFVNLTGLLSILGGRFLLFYFGTKVLLPLPASIIYMILSFDLDRPDQGKSAGEFGDLEDQDDKDILDEESILFIETEPE